MFKNYASIKKIEAEKLDAASLDRSKKSDAAMYRHRRRAQAMTAEQIAISLAAITRLTRKKWLELAPSSVAGVGPTFGLKAWLHF